MPDLDRTLAFTALIDVSPDFRALPLLAGAEVVSDFLEDHEVYVRTYSHGKVVMGKTDMRTFARVWVKSYFPYES